IIPPEESPEFSFLLKEVLGLHDKVELKKLYYDLLVNQKVSSLPKEVDEVDEAISLVEKFRGSVAIVSSAHLKSMPPKVKAVRIEIRNAKDNKTPKNLVVN
ncbi:MAG: hypothetical protein D6808_02620, partial [Candidatus Dadabacteria bacterium]